MNRKYFCFLSLLLLFIVNGFSQRQMEMLDRGVVAVRNKEGKVFVGWRLLGTESKTLAFNVYRSLNGKIQKLNRQPIADVTHFIDNTTDTTKTVSYFVKAIEKGKEAAASKSFILKPGN